jgi:murein DD-endopeptidase MepM/ murein hydrolase activator NlpD
MGLAHEVADGTSLFGTRFTEFFRGGKKMDLRSPGETARAVKMSISEFFDQQKERFPESKAVFFIPALILIVVGFLVTTSLQPDAYAVLIDGQEVAVVEDQAFAEEVFQKICTDFSSEQEVFTEKEVSYKKVGLQGREPASESELRKIYLAHLNFLTNAVAITVDGESVAWVKDEAAAKEVLQKFKDTFTLEDAQMLSLEYENELAYSPGTVKADQVMDCNSVVNLLKNGTDKVVSHTVAEGESLWTIARNNDTRVADILKANPGLTEDSILPIGHQIKLTKSEPLVHVQAVYKKTVKGVVPFKVEYVKDSKLASGQMKVKQAGRNGEKEVVYRFRTRDGVKIGQEKLGGKVTKEPVTKIVAAGSRVMLASRGGSSDGGGGGGTGSLRWPTSASRISQGYRGGHRAIDIDGNSGDPVVAADGGTVTFAGWSGGYGYCVLINHGNGMTTRYAHCSKLSVSKGDKVSKGEVIGRVGSTGRSTGSHLHFEVIVNGTPRNPLNYLK